MMLHPLEEAMVRAFILPNRRERYLTLLGDAKHRRKALARLNHCLDFDPRYATSLPSNADVAVILKAHGAGPACHVISTYTDIDGSEIGIEQALEATDYWPSILCCLPGRLAYYAGEDGEQRRLLERT